MRNFALWCRCENKTVDSVLFCHECRWAGPSIISFCSWKRRGVTCPRRRRREGGRGLSGQGSNTLRPHCSTPLFTVSNENQADFIHAPNVQLKAECVDGMKGGVSKQDSEHQPVAAKSAVQTHITLQCQISVI